MAVLEAIQVHKHYGADGQVRVHALRGVDVRVEKGEFLAIMGPSGCGKSTLLNLMGLLDVPSSGKIAIDGEEVASYADRHLAGLRNRSIGFIFQSFHLVPDLSVLDNVQIPLLYRKMSGGARRDAARRALERVGLGARLHHFPSQLSGGQQQRVAVARAVVGNPRVLLADEPTGNLDSQMGDEIMGILKDLHIGENTTIVMVTHDERLAQGTERIVRLFDGRQVQ
jgi:putative ABC transport system ATP-binding protein